MKKSGKKTVRVGCGDASRVNQPKGKRKVALGGSKGRKARRFNSANLRSGKKSKYTQTDPVLTQRKSVTHGTQTTNGYLQASAGTYSTADRCKDKCLAALGRLRDTTPPGFHWTKLMLVVVLRFVFHAVVHLNWSWSSSTQEAGRIFNIRSRNVQIVGLQYINPAGDALQILPRELARKKVGRGSAKFLANDVDERFKVLKAEHLTAILEYVRSRNRSMSGMCTVRAIQAHLLHKFNKLLKPSTILYGMRVRLGLKYRSTSGKRIVFTAHRIQLADEFCEKIIAALTEEAAGRCVLVYMDETYCHQHHMPGRAWQEDDDAAGAVRCERSRSKGRLMIILHALTRDGMLFKEVNGERPEPEEWERGKVLNCEMIFRANSATGRRDYHDTMDGEMFERWLTKRLIPTFKAKYGRDMKMVLVLDNAPYHHVRPDDSFFATGKSKTVIKEKLIELGVDSIDVRPFTHEQEQFDRPINNATTPWSDFEQWVFVEETTGLVYLIDGAADQGFGDVMVYARVTKRRLTVVESSMLDDFRRLLDEDFRLIGCGPAAIRYARSIMHATSHKVSARLRHNVPAMRAACRDYARASRDLVWTYTTDVLDVNYNGAGGVGTGGPKLEWLRPAVDQYIIANHPELRLTKVMKIFANLGHELIFTVPYWAKSQPAELAWAYDKGYVARNYFPGRHMKDLREQIKCGFYGGPVTDGGEHRPIDSGLACRFIKHTHKHINEYINTSDRLKNKNLRCILGLP